MTKSELETLFTRHEAELQKAISAEKRGSYREALDTALGGLPTIDGMIQYRRKHIKVDIARIPLIDTVFRFAPLFLDEVALHRVGNFLDSCGRIEKPMKDDLRKNLNAARVLMRLHGSFWTYLELNPGASEKDVIQHMGKTPAYWQRVIDTWEKMEVISRSAVGAISRLSLKTRMGQIISGKCPGCGEIVEAPKAMLLDSVTCPKCNGTMPFVLLA